MTMAEGLRSLSLAPAGIKAEYKLHMDAYANTLLQCLLALWRQGTCIQGGSCQPSDFAVTEALFWCELTPAVAQRFHTANVLAAALASVQRAAEVSLPSMAACAAGNEQGLRFAGTKQAVVLKSALALLRLATSGGTVFAASAPALLCGALSAPDRGV